MTVLYVLLAILMLGILVMVHEGGHFFAARLMKIDVTEFAMGFGPKLFGWQSKKHDTKFSVRAIPFGGYCAFVGDETDMANTEDPRAFAKQNVWKRMFTVLMGPMMNLLLAFIVATVFYWSAGVQMPVGLEPVISEVAVDGPAYGAGLRDGDTILAINGQDMQNDDLELTGVTEAISAWKEGDTPLGVTVRRGEDETLTLEMTPFWDAEENRYRVGIMIGGHYILENRTLNLPQAVKESWDLCVYASGAILSALKDLVTTGAGLDQTAGPVGVVRLVSEETQAGGFSSYIQLMVLISINLGLMNLLPIPGLDGSRLVFGLIEAIRGKPVPQKIEGAIHLCGMALLFAVLIFFTFRDVAGLFH